MRRSTHRVLMFVLGCLLLGLTETHAQELNPVETWARIIQPAVQAQTPPGTRPPASSEVLHAMIHLAVYNAVVAIEGGSKPYGHPIEGPRWADVRAAVATAAYLVARERVDSSYVSTLDAQYAQYMLGIPPGTATRLGVRVGTLAARAMLEMRDGDGFDDTLLYACTTIPPPPGEFEPNGGCGTPPVDVKLSQIRPYTFRNVNAFRPSGPDPLTSNAYLEDFEETRDYGRATGSVRTAEQTDVAFFWSENTYAQWNRNLIDLAVVKGLDVRETARLFAMAHTASADAIIAGFSAKYFYRAWRPRTAIPLADVDGNPDTDADPTWLPLLSVNHPEYPAAHGFWSSALTDAVAAFFGTSRVTWTIDSKAGTVVQKQRSYDKLSAIIREVDDARVWSGLHWRHSMRDGDQLGRRVARHVLRHFFRLTD